MIEGAKYSKYVDVWAIGVITFILLCGRTPFSGDDNRELFHNIRECMPVFKPKHWAHISAEAKAFVSGILVRTPSVRGTCHDLMKHSWLNNMGQACHCDLSRSLGCMKKWNDGGRQCNKDDFFADCDSGVHGCCGKSKFKGKGLDVVEVGTDAPPIRESSTSQFFFCSVMGNEHGCPSSPKSAEQTGEAMAVAV